MAVLGVLSGKGCLHCTEVTTVGISFSASSGNKIPERPTPSAQSGQNISFHRALSRPTQCPIRESCWDGGGRLMCSLICISGKN